jgi:hypothetical protein
MNIKNGSPYFHHCDTSGEMRTKSQNTFRKQKEIFKYNSVDKYKLLIGTVRVGSGK